MQTQRFSAIYCDIGLIYLETYDDTIHLQPAPSGWYP